MEGWNDPMDLSKFEATGKLKINLNKRVAFPLNKPPNTAQDNTNEPLRALPTLPCFGINEEQNNNICNKPDLVESSSFDPQAAKQRVFNIIQNSISQLNPSVQSNVQAKLKSLENEWDSCDIDLQKLLVQLTEYIHQKDGKNAGGIQRKIIMKGYNKPWMQGIRQIVFSLESNDNENIADA